MTARPRTYRGAVGIGRTAVPLGSYFIAVLVLLYLPIALLVVFSIQSNTTLRFPLEGVTLDWYAAVLRDDALLTAARNSFIVAAGAASAATVIGSLVAVAVVRFQFRGRGILLALAGLPLLVPFVVLGVALFLLFITLDVPRSLLTVGAAHSVIATPFAMLIVLSRLSGLDSSLEDAAMDLGATYWVTLRRVVVPLMGSSLLSAWLTSFIVSFDEVAIAVFLVGGDPTFPVFLYGQLRFAQRLPVLIAMAVLLMLGTVAMTLVALRFRAQDR